MDRILSAYRILLVAGLSTAAFATSCKSGELVLVNRSDQPLVVSLETVRGNYPLVAVASAEDERRVRTGEWASLAPGLVHYRDADSSGHVIVEFTLGPHSAALLGEVSWSAGNRWPDRVPFAKLDVRTGDRHEEWSAMDAHLAFERRSSGEYIHEFRL